MSGTANKEGADVDRDGSLLISNPIKPKEVVAGNVHKGIGVAIVELSLGK